MEPPGRVGLKVYYPVIKSFNSILGREVMRSLESDSFTHAEQTISRFICFYNNETMHLGVDYYTSGHAYLKWK